MEQFGQVNVLVFPPPSCSTLVSVVFNQREGGEFLEVVIEVVPVHAKLFLKLNGAHLLGLGQCNIGCTASRVGKSGGDGVASHSSHSRTYPGDGSVGFEDVVSNPTVRIIHGWVDISL